MFVQLSRALRPFIPVCVLIGVTTEVTHYTLFVAPTTYYTLALLLAAGSVLAILEQIAERMYEIGR